MTRRTKRKENTEQEKEGPISVEEALNTNIEVTIYDKFADIVSQYGSNLLLRIYAIKSDSRSLGFIDEIVGDEIDLFLQAPEGFLRDKFGSGTFRIIVVNGGTKKFITNLTISISSPKNLTPTPNTDYLGEVTKSFKEGINLGKSSSQPNNNQTPLDLTKLVELVMIQQEKSREREEKTLERIRNAEIRLREKELQLIERAYSNNVDITAHMKPFLDSMGVYGKMLSNSMSMIERALDFKERFNTDSVERPFLERILIGIGSKFVDSNPQIFDKLTAIIPQMNIPEPNAPVSAGIPLGNNPRTENKTPKEELNPKGETQVNQFNLDFAFPVILSKYIKRATRNEDPGFCADSFIADLEDLLSEKLISGPQLDQAYKLLISDDLETYVKNFFPDAVRYRAWLIDFQTAIKEGISEPQEGNETQTTN